MNSYVIDANIVPLSSTRIVAKVLGHMTKKPKRSNLDAIADVKLHLLMLHPLSLFLLATVAVIVAGNWLWQVNRNRLMDRDAYRLTTERMTVSRKPDWIRSDLVQTAFDGSGLGEVNLLDTDAVTKVAQAFAVQPWVRDVAVRKSSRDIRVDLTYRRPVGLVEYADDLLLPVDGQGTVLDGNDFNPASTSEFLRITVQSPLTGSLVSGDVWPDDRVVAAAMLAGRIADHAKTWGIVRVKLDPITPNSTDAAGEFELLTIRGLAGTKILWGSPPGCERSKESTADQKIAMLDEFVTQHGSLDKVGTSQTIDLRFDRIRLASNQDASF